MKELEPPASRLRRLIEAAAFVFLWVAVGLFFRPRTNVYLLAGLPFTLVFQKFVRKRPIADLWVRGAVILRLKRYGFTLAALLAIYPVSQLASTLAHPESHRLLLSLIWIVALLSCFPAAYAFQNFHKKTWKQLCFCVMIVGGLGSSLFLMAYLANHHGNEISHSLLVKGAKSFLFYLPYMFLIEEVSFRGLLDAHVHLPGEKNGILSAIFVSILWGLWHLPTISPLDLRILPQLILFHCLLGIPLSLFWRRSGNLGVPVVSHAVVDSVRNALGLLA